jgi:maltose alpha-D-glucosyltransferase/alpha-amylase
VYHLACGPPVERVRVAATARRFQLPSILSDAIGTPAGWSGRVTAEATFGAVARFVAGIAPPELSSARWYGGKGREVAAIDLAEAFALDPAALLAIVDVTDTGGGTGRYSLPLRHDVSGLALAADGDGTWRSLAVAVAEGRTIAALPKRARTPGTPAPASAALVCRPASALRDLAPGGARGIGAWPERPLGLDQSNTSVVLGEQLLLKAYRRLEDGLNPDLELSAYLAEELGFAAVPRLAGFIEMVSASGAATVALLQEFVVDAADAYEATAERLAAWIVAPGTVTVEFATEEAAELGTLTAELHAALAAGAGIPGFEPRPATREELRGWRRAAHVQLQRAIDALHGDEGEVLRSMAPVIAEQLTVIEASPSVPLVTRVHADYHLGQVMIAPDGWRIVDFEGEPTRPIDERRRHHSPLRDVASMLRSIDHAGRSARRRAEARNGGAVESPGLDIEAWLKRARERFVESYRRGLVESGAPIDVDEDLLRAFEFEKETYEFLYAATYLPEWLWAPLEGMRALVDEASSP